MVTWVETDSTGTDLEADSTGTDLEALPEGVATVLPVLELSTLGTLLVLEVTTATLLVVAWTELEVMTGVETLAVEVEEAAEVETTTEALELAGVLTAAELEVVTTGLEAEEAW